MNIADKDLIFTDSEGIYNVILPYNEFEKIQKYCNDAKPCETGGILIGKYSEDCTIALIQDATFPPRDSRHKRACFFRGRDNLIEKLNEAWVQGCYYIGEWHYHPNSLPTPSLTDLYQMRILATDEKLNCPEPILLIIGERDYIWEMHVEICCKTKYIRLLQI